MEIGFYHVERGYWQAVGEPSAALMASFPAGTVEVPLKPGPDYEWVSGAWVHNPPDPEVVAAARREELSLSFSQLLIGLVELGFITEAEGEAWLSGAALPAEVEALVVSLPVGERFRARARMLRMSVALRTDPLVAALAASREPAMSAEEVDQFFEAYSEV